MQDTQNIDAVREWKVEDEPVFKTRNRPLPKPAGESARKATAPTKLRSARQQIDGFFDGGQKSLSGLEAGFSIQVVEMIRQVGTRCRT